MKRLIVILASVLILAAACAGGSGSGATDRAVIEVTATDFRFEPATWEIPAGKPVRIIVHNRGVLEHDVTIPSLKIVVKANPGKDVTKDFNTIAAGTYDFECTVAGHKESGMVGKLIVK